jgi:hypothetical protein
MPEVCANIMFLAHIRSFNNERWITNPRVAGSNPAARPSFTCKTLKNRRSSTRRRVAGDDVTSISFSIENEEQEMQRLVEVVEAHGAGQTDPFEERLKRRRGQVLGVRSRAPLRREYEAAVLPKSTNAEPLSVLDRCLTRT